MANMKEDILYAIRDELDTAIIVVISHDDVIERNRKFPIDLIGKPVPLKDVINYFDYEFDDGYGGQECHDFYIWTTKEVFYIHEYDGSTCIYSVPRNPIMRIEK
jgi:hypothetical protein